MAGNRTLTTKRENSKEGIKSLRGAVCTAARCTLRGLEVPKNHQADGCRHQNLVACVCGSIMAVSRLQPIVNSHPKGHEVVGFVEEVGARSNRLSRQFSIGSFHSLRQSLSQLPYSDTSRLPASRTRRRRTGSVLRSGSRTAPWSRTPDILRRTDPELCTLYDVMGKGWFAADAANVKTWPRPVAVVGDGGSDYLG